MKKSNFSKKILTKIEKLDSQDIKEIFLSLSQKNESFQNSLDGLPFGYFVICKKNYQILFNNQYSLRYLKKSKVQGEILFNVLKPSELGGLLKKKFDHLEKIESLEFFLGKNELNIYCHPITSEGGIIKYNLLIYDVTEWKKKHLKKNLEESITSLQKLTRGIAHEIKNPLGALDLHLKLIQRHFKEKKINKNYVEELTGIIQEEIIRLNQTIEDFLMASKPMELQKEFANLNRVVEEIITVFKPIFKEANISCSLKLNKKLPICKLDVYAIKQVVMNLIKNAIEAITESEKVKKGKIQIETEFDDEKIICNIYDNGIGISSADLTQITRPYYTTKKTGTGLGLSIVESILRRHDAEIFFFSEKKQTKVTLYFYFDKKKFLIENDQL